MISKKSRNNMFTSPLTYTQIHIHQLKHIHTHTCAQTDYFNKKMRQKITKYNQ